MLAGVDRHNGGAAVGMSQEVMATADANNLKAGSSQGGKNLFATHSRESTHVCTRMRCTPTNCDD